MSNCYSSQAEYDDHDFKGGICTDCGEVDRPAVREMAKRPEASEARVEPEPPTGLYVEVLARFIDEAHLDRMASAEWRGVWHRPLKLTGYESTRDVQGKVLQQTLRFEGGLQITSQNPHLRVKVWV